MSYIDENDNFVYVYKSPLDQGYTKIKVSKTRHNQVFMYRQRTFFKSLFMKYEYFSNENQVIVEYLPNLLAKTIVLVLLPVYPILFGVWNYKEGVQDTKKILSPRKYGSFVMEVVQGEKVKVLLGID